MIPPDIAARLRHLLLQEFLRDQPGTTQVEAVHRVAPADAVPDQLPSELREGQLFRATIQRPLPNGTYLALVAGREMTLAIDRPLKSGDTLELIVTERATHHVRAREAGSSFSSSSARATLSLPPFLPTSSQTNFSPLGDLLRRLLTAAPPPAPQPLLFPSPPATPSFSPSPPPSLSSTALPSSASPSAAPVPPPSTSSSSSPTSSAPLIPSPLLRSPSPTTFLSPSLPPFSGAAEPQKAAAEPQKSSLLPNPSPLSAPSPRFITPALWVAINERLATTGAPLTPSQLADSVTTSGLFYESHLARWVEGRHPLTELRREPQASFVPSPFSPPSSTASLTSSQSGLDRLITLVQQLLGLSLAETSEHSSSLPSSPPLSSPPEPTLSRGNASTALPSSDEKGMASLATSSAESPSLPIPETLLPTVQRQLDALAHQRLDFQFFPWAGANVRWQLETDTIDEGTAHTASSQEEAPRWRSSLTIESEALGRITFALDYSPAGLALAATAERPETQSLLKSHMQQLIDALAADAIPLLAFTWRDFSPAPSLPTSEASS
ncbi:MAG: flagellar hook-length control protein FliK [Hydrogenophilus sp.]|nr:flagellar hook-length control protein FliK [Hydrogenophilus sp.]